MIAEGKNNKDIQHALDTGDYPALFDAITTSADEGAAESQHELAQIYADGMGYFKYKCPGGDSGYVETLGCLDASSIMSSPDLELEIKRLLNEAEQGDVRAQWICANLFYRGHYGRTADLKTSFKWYHKAANQGCLKAQSSLAWLYQGEHAELLKRYGYQDSAEYWLRMGAEQGSRDAQYELSALYAHGVGVFKNEKEAFKWLYKAADQGLTDAQHDLGTAYDAGKGTPRDTEESIKWYRRAAWMGSAAAERRLNSLGCREWGLTQDHNKSIKWFQEAANQGYADACYELGLIYRDGIGRPKDLKKAIEWYRKGATLGDEYACIHLGCMYRDGNGVPRDTDEAFKWFRSGSQQGGFAAHGHLVSLLLADASRSQDTIECIKLLRDAAKQGDECACIELGEMYLTGKVVPINIKNSIRWYSKAAELGDTFIAPMIMGGLYRHGRVVSLDIQQAIKWYRVAAERGSGDAQYALGEIYSEDQSGLKNIGLPMAYFWFGCAKSSGSHAFIRKSKAACKKLLVRMTPDQTLRGMKLLGEKESISHTCDMLDSHYYAVGPAFNRSKELE